MLLCTLNSIDGVDGGGEAEAVAIEVHGFDAVVVEAVLRVARAVGRHADGLADRAAQASDGDAARRAGIHAGREQRELDEGAAVERQFDHLLASMTVPTVAFSVCSRIAFGRHLNAFRRLSHRHLYVDSRNLVDAQRKRCHFGLLKAGLLDGDRIFANLKERKLVVTLRIRLRCPHLTCLTVANGDGCRREPHRPMDR